MKLKEKNEIDLDIDVNSYLKSWKIPSNNGWQPKVTLRQLLSHTAGMTVSGFGGYSIHDSIPTTVQILNGEYPANSLPVKVNIFPGTRARYSGGGFIVAQLILEDKFNLPFFSVMDSLVLFPLHLKTSTFEQPISKAKQQLNATGYVLDYQPINGGFDIHPEMAAAGLWTNPLDLAKILVRRWTSRKRQSRRWRAAGPPPPTGGRLRPHCLSPRGWQGRARARPQPASSTRSDDETLPHSIETVGWRADYSGFSCPVADSTSTIYSRQHPVTFS